LPLSEKHLDVNYSLVKVLYVPTRYRCSRCISLRKLVNINEAYVVTFSGNNSNNPIYIARVWSLRGAGERVSRSKLITISYCLTHEVILYILHGHQSPQTGFTSRLIGSYF